MGLYFFNFSLTAQYCFLPKIRRAFYAKIFSTDETKVRKFLGKYEANVHSFSNRSSGIHYFSYHFSFLLALIGIDITMQQLTSLFVLGLSINVFWAAYLSTLTKANLYIDFGIDRQRDFKPEIIVNP